MKGACPKCNNESGDDWTQCAGSCPVPGSPHFNIPLKPGRSIMYVGEVPEYVGKKALLYKLEDNTDHAWIQFDDMALPQHHKLSKKDLIAAYIHWPEDIVSYTRNIEGEIDPEHGPELMTTKEFEDAVKMGAFNDDDGFGHPVKDGYGDWNMKIYPSEMDQIPMDATHIAWFNK